MLRRISKGYKKTFSAFRKIMIGFLVLSFVTAVFIRFSNIGKTKFDYQKSLTRYEETIYKPINDPELNSSDSGKMKLLLYRSLSCSLVGETCADTPEESKKFASGSVFGIVTNGMSMTFENPPASGVLWAQDGLASAGFAPKAYAAEGIGFASIKGFMSVWKAFRDIALLLMVVVTVVLGFLIMFRTKLDGQTAVNIESILPRIALTMIYITFSFAIAGFLIDLMYVLIGLITSVIWGSALGHNAYEVTRLQDTYIGAGFQNLLFVDSNPIGVGSAFWRLIPGGFRALLDLFLIKPIGTLLTQVLTYKWSPLSGMLENLNFSFFGTGVGVGGFISNLIRLSPIILLSLILGWILPGLIIGFLIFLTMFYFAIRVFFILLTSYIKIMLYIMFAPIIIVFEIIPGNSNFSWWIRNLAGEISSFITTITLLLAGTMINEVNNISFLQRLSGSTTGALGTDPTGIVSMPFLYGFKPADFNIIVALGIILVIPDFIKMVKGWLGVQDSQLNFGIGTFFTGATAIAGGSLGLASTTGGLATSLPGLRNYMTRVPGLKQLIGKPPTDE